MNRKEAFERLDDVREEYSAAAFSIGRTLRHFDDDSSMRQSGPLERITLHSLEKCDRNLEITSLLRLFAEFEGVLRDYCANGRKRSTTPPMIDLLNGIAAYRFINADDLLGAHEIREYRNSIVHEHLQDPQFGFSTCRSRLARFLRWLPQTW
jgi:hypothetical protein